MKIKIDFTEKTILNLIDRDFPFFTIYRIMEATNWRWFDSPNIPTFDRIKKTLFNLINSAKKYGCAGTGGFEVEYKEGTYNIRFDVATFAFTEKSDKWDNEDLSYLSMFIDKVEATEIILNSTLALLRNSEKDIFFMRKCNEFIDSGLSYEYDKKLGLIFRKEDNDDETPSLYELIFVGVDKSFEV